MTASLRECKTSVGVRILPSSAVTSIVPIESMKRAAGKAAIKHEPRDALRVGRGVSHTRGRTLRHAQQYERLLRIGCCGNNGLQISDPTFERQVADIPVSHPASSLIVTNEPEVI